MFTATAYAGDHATQHPDVDWASSGFTLADCATLQVSSSVASQRR